jgi:hypothetical protein
MKILFISISLMVAGLCVGLVATGCNTTQQRLAYTTLSAVEMTTTAAVDGYYMATIKGIASTNGIPKVSKAFNAFQDSFKIAVDLAQNNTNALAPLPLQQESADVIALVGQFYSPSLEKPKTKATP